MLPWRFLSGLLQVQGLKCPEEQAPYWVGKLLENSSHEPRCLTLSMTSGRCDILLFMKKASVNQSFSSQRLSATTRSSAMFTKHAPTFSRIWEGRKGTNRNMVRPDVGEPRPCPSKNACCWVGSSWADSKWAFGRPQIPLASKVPWTLWAVFKFFLRRETELPLWCARRWFQMVPCGNPRVWVRQWL